MIGDEGVGKTSLVQRYTTSLFKSDYLPTVGANLVAKEFSIEGEIITLVIWDIAAQELFGKVRDKYYAGANIAVLVYDITAQNTLKNTRTWLNDLRKSVRSDIPLALVGNKIDLTKRAVSAADGQKMAKELGAYFVETSAKTGENVRNLFESLLKLVMAKYRD